MLIIGVGFAAAVLVLVLQSAPYDEPHRPAVGITAALSIFALVVSLGSLAINVVKIRTESILLRAEASAFISTNRTYVKAAAGNFNTISLADWKASRCKGCTLWLDVALTNSGLYDSEVEKLRFTNRVSGSLPFSDGAEIADQTKPSDLVPAAGQRERLLAQQTIDVYVAVSDYRKQLSKLQYPVEVALDVTMADRAEPRHLDLGIWIDPAA